NWSGVDVTDQLNLDFDKNWNKFISEALVYQYIHKGGQQVNFIILDAGNFHHPNACFTSAGFQIRELPEREFHLKGRTLKSHTLFTERANESFLSFYWIIIDKKIAHEWIEQKIKQLFYSLFNRKRIGLMVRVDIPAKEDSINNAMVIADQFVSDLSEELKPEQADYIFGESESSS
ncbi:MAG: exosortase C-terminal domain/associated protein EpsI, partial [Planctomycetota bacterium]